MARPRNGSAPARDRIVEVAGRLFYEKGLHQVGINEVIDRSGVARMTLYHHFASKSDLVEACLVERSCQRMAEIDAAIDRCRLPNRRVLAVFDVLAAHAAAADFRGCLFINLAIDRADAGDAAHALVAKHKQALAARFERVARDAGWRRPASLAVQLLLLWDGAAIEAWLQQSSRPVKDARAAASSLIAAASR